MSKYKKCPVGTEIQSVIFDKKYFNTGTAARWLRRNEFKIHNRDKADEKENTIRFRQQPPSLFDKDLFRTIELTTGVQAVIGCKKNKKAANGGAEEIDLFEQYDLQPAKVRKITNKYAKKYEEEGSSYELNKKMLAELNKVGYTFDYGLDGDPFNLRKIQTGKNKQAKAENGGFVQPDWLFMGTYPNAIVYADKSKEKNGMYYEFGRIVFNPFEVKVYDNSAKYADAIVQMRLDAEKIKKEGSVEVSSTDQRADINVYTKAKAKVDAMSDHEVVQESSAIFHYDMADNEVTAEDLYNNIGETRKQLIDHYVEEFLPAPDNEKLFAEGGKLDRIDEMVSNYKSHHWAKSQIGNDDAEFFKRAGLNTDEVGITSFTGNDLVYYDIDKVYPRGGSMIPIHTQKQKDGGEKYILYQIRPDIAERKLRVPVGEYYVEDVKLRGRWNGNTFELFYKGKWNEAQSIDWDSVSDKMQEGGRLTPAQKKEIRNIAGAHNTQEQAFDLIEKRYKPDLHSAAKEYYGIVKMGNGGVMFGFGERARVINPNDVLYLMTGDVVDITSSDIGLKLDQSRDAWEAGDVEYFHPTELEMVAEQGGVNRDEYEKAHAAMYLKLMREHKSPKEFNKKYDKWIKQNAPKYGFEKGEYKNGGALEQGINVEHEHRDLYLYLKKKLKSEGCKMPISEREFYKWIAKVHLREREDYYLLLKKHVEK
jgi:hypothetical protein